MHVHVYMKIYLQYDCGSDHPNDKDRGGSRYKRKRDNTAFDIMYSFTLLQKKFVRYPGADGSRCDQNNTYSGILVSNWLLSRNV